MALSMSLRLLGGGGPSSSLENVSDAFLRLGPVGVCTITKVSRTYVNDNYVPYLLLY